MRERVVERVGGSKIRVTHEEQRSELYSIYLRPWTLERSHATAAVPYVGNLMRISANHLSDATSGRERKLHVPYRG